MLLPMQATLMGAEKSEGFMCCAYANPESTMSNKNKTGFFIGLDDVSSENDKILFKAKTIQFRCYSDALKQLC
jgi:hypothetical protein